MLREFLVNHGVKVAGPLRHTQLLGGRSNLTFRVYDNTSAWVVRRPPSRGRTPSAHDMAREWAVTTRLQEGPIPVARTIAADLEGTLFGFPFTVVEYVKGRVLRRAEDLEDLSDAALRGNAQTLVETLARLHSADYAQLGLENFGRPVGFVARQVSLWRRQWDLVKTRDLADLDRLTTSLSDSLPTRTSRSTIVHGDFRVDNTILCESDLTRVKAVVDWEMSTLGDPLTDVALMCAYRQPVFDLVMGSSSAWTSSRYPAPDELAEMYATASGSTLEHWSFYLGLANLKLAVISEGIAHRARHTAAHDEAATHPHGTGTGSQPTFDARSVAEATPAFVAAGLLAMATDP